MACLVSTPEMQRLPGMPAVVFSVVAEKSSGESNSLYFKKQGKKCEELKQSEPNLTPNLTL